MSTWPNRDPIEEKGGIHLYGFVSNAPIAMHDEDGRMPAWAKAACRCGAYGVIAAGTLWCTSDARCLNLVEANLLYATRLVDRMTDLAHFYDGFESSINPVAQGTVPDAIRHCIGACESAKNPGSCITANRAYATIQGREEAEAETGNPFSQSDMLNNDAGFKVAQAGTDCRQGCLQAWRNGLLSGVNRNHPRLPVYRIQDR